MSINQSIDFVIHGGQKLSGQVKTNTSKNGAMGLLSASLLNYGTTILHGIPQIEEVKRICEVLVSIGVKVEWLDKNSIKIQRPEVLDLQAIDFDSASKTRTIIMFLGALIHDFVNFDLPNSQGCKLGKRTIKPHLYALQKLGVNIKVKETKYKVDATELKKLKDQRDKIEREIIMFEKGDTATENILIATAKMPGITKIKFASSNYMVQDVCFFLKKLGIKIEGIGTSTLIVHGKPEINTEIRHCNSEDPIESMMWVSAAICTGSELSISRVPIEFLELELFKLEKMGLDYEVGQKYKAENEHTDLADIIVRPSQLIASEEKITCGPFPDINIDNLPFFVPISALAKGQTLIHDWVYENRAIYFLELSKLGVSMILADPHRVYINGPTEFKPAQVVCPPALRPAMIILIAMLGTQGTSILRNVYSIKRGYEEIAERLNLLGAKIEIIKS